MLRRVRRQRLCRVAIGVAFTLVAFAGSAAAECAWVLWQNPLLPNDMIDIRAWQPKQGFASPDHCLRAIEAFGKREPNFDYRCLPDTVDPRGPKGGGR